MKPLISALFILVLLGCESTKESAMLVFPDYEKEAPDENRFVKEVLAGYLYEPTEMDILPDGRVLFVERRGGVKLYDPNSQELFSYDSVPVFYSFEDGLMGLALDPNFQYNRWVYIYYSPLGEDPKQHLSRFRFTEKGLADEKVMLVVPTQREECCHTGGSIQFGSDGLLYLSTGDNTNPFFSDGFGPMDDSTDKTSRDARGTSSNTNDLRGKILRIRPEADGSYTIPRGNLFEDEDPRTKPEIYVMGCRNPYRISVDPKRNWLFWGEVGPDAPNDQEGRGPRGHDEINVAMKSGYFGWPLFVGDNKAYRDYDFGAKKSGDSFAPARPINDSKFNTGLRELPPANPAMIWYPYANSVEFPMLGTGGRNAMAGPVFYSDRYPYSTTRLPAYFDGRLFIYDWIRGWIFSVQVENGKARDFYRLMPDTQFDYIIDMELGPDGSLYLLEYGTGWFTKNQDSKLSHIRYIRGNRTPVLQATTSMQNGAAPLVVQFDASASFDYDGDSLRFVWEIEGEKILTKRTEYTFEKEGIYYPRITVRDKKGNTQTRQFVVEVGNEAPKVDIEIEGNSTFFFPGREIRYRVVVSDKEDGHIDPESVDFEINYIKGFDRTAVTGHQKPVSNGQTIMEGSDCKACHKLDEPSVGPSYMMISGRYSKTNSQKYLANKIRQGGGGVWGEHAMAAHPDISEEQALQVVDYILSLTASKAPLTGAYITEKADADGQYLFTASYSDKGAGSMHSATTTKTISLLNSHLPANQYAIGEGLKSGNEGVNNLLNGSWFAFMNIDLKDVKSIKGVFSKNAMEGKWLIRLDDSEGQLAGTFDLALSKGGIIEVPISVSGRHDLYFILETNQREPISCSELEFVFN